MFNGVDMLLQGRPFHTGCLLWAFLTLGWVIGQLGPVLPDLRLIINKDLDTTCLMLTAFPIGYMTGSLFGGLLYDRFNKTLLLFLSALGLAGSTASIPLCSHIVLMGALFGFSGLFFGSLETGGTAHIILLWGEKTRPFMQALHLTYAAGAIASPFATEPFLAHEIGIRKPSILNTTNSTMNSTQSQSSSQSNDEGTIYFTNSSKHSVGIANTSEGYVLSSEDDARGTTKIQFAFFITGGLVSLAAIFFFIILFLSIKQDAAAEEEDNQNGDTIPRPWYFVLIFVVSAMLFSYVAVEDTFSTFIMTFSLLHLGWTKTQGAQITSLFWGSLFFGRLVGMFLATKLKSNQLLRGSVLIWILSLGSLLAGSMTKVSPVIWVFVGMSGFSMSVIYPCILTWTSEKIIVSGKISGIFLVCSAIGPTINPGMLGYLMNEVAPVWFVYLLLCEGLLFTILYIFAQMIAGDMPCKWLTCVKQRPRLRQRPSIRKKMTCMEALYAAYTIASVLTDSDVETKPGLLDNEIGIPLDDNNFSIFKGLAKSEVDLN